MRKLLLILIFIIFNLFSFTQNQNNIDVTNYEISLDFTDMQNEHILGYTDLTINLSTDLNVSNLKLDLLKLNVDSVFLYNININQLPISAEFIYNDTIITISIPESFPLEPNINIKIYYHGHPVRGIGAFGGFYFSGNYAFNMGVSLYDIPHNFGKVWFPCNDNFIDRAKYHFFITTTPENTAVCNGILENIIETDTTKIYEWKLDEEIPTYLASVAVSNFDLWQSEYQGISKDIPINIYAVNMENIAISFQNLNSALAIFEDKFGEYRWNRIGYVAVPFNAGAMEHATNIAIGNSMIVNGVSYEDVFYHELAHHWFGDLITCRTAEDMWLNEGISTYCETIFREFHYGKDNGKNYRRAAHLRVVKDLNYEDGGFLAISPMLQNLTYSQTVYEKGASIAHALRGYLGDEIFFNGMKEFLNQNAFSDLSSEDLRDFLSDYSGIDLNDFFNDWVFTGGFVHYAIDSVVFLPSYPEFPNYKVYIRQKLRGRETFANSNRVELTFIDPDYNTQIRTMEFDGEYGEETFQFNMFNPVLVLCDLNEKQSDATFDSYKFVKTIGQINFPSTNTKITVTSVPATDSAFVRVTHNLVSPDSTKISIPGVFTINSRYWLIEGIFPEEFKAKSEFSFNTTFSAHLDYGFITNVIDSMVLLYRPDRSAYWAIEDAVFSKSLKKFTVDSLKLGEYCFGIYNWNEYISTDNRHNLNSNNNILIFPNPAQNYVEIKFPKDEKYNIQMYNIDGKSVLHKKNSSDFVKIDVAKLKNGIYILEIENFKGEVIKKERIIKN